MNQLVPIVRSCAVPALMAAAGERAGMRFLEFFAANIRNPHTRGRGRTLPPSSATTVSGRRGSLHISRTAGRSKRPPLWRTMRRRAQRSFTIADATSLALDEVEQIVI